MSRRHLLAVGGALLITLPLSATEIGYRSGRIDGIFSNTIVVGDSGYRLAGSLPVYDPLGGKGSRYDLSEGDWVRLTVEYPPNESRLVTRIDQLIPPEE